MYLDKLGQLSDEQAVTASAASTNVVDTGASRDVGPGVPLAVVVTVDTTTVSAGATTLDLKIQCDTDEAFGSAKDLTQIIGLAKADLTAGKVAAVLVVPPSCERYVRLYFTVNTANFSAGAFSAHLIPLDAVQTKDASYSY